MPDSGQTSTLWRMPVEVQLYRSSSLCCLTWVLSMSTRHHHKSSSAMSSMPGPEHNPSELFVCPCLLCNEAAEACVVLAHQAQVPIGSRNCTGCDPPALACLFNASDSVEDERNERLMSCCSLANPCIRKILRGPLKTSVTPRCPMNLPSNNFRHGV